MPKAILLDKESLRLGFFRFSFSRSLMLNPPLGREAGPRARSKDTCAEFAVDH